MHQWLHAGKPVAIGRVQVVRQVEADHDARRRGIDAHVVRRVVEELCARIPLNVVRVKVAPPQLHVNPKLLRRQRRIKLISACISKKGGLAHGPLVGCKEEDVSARAVHLVRLAWVDRLLLDGLDF